jgi:Fe-S-cluster-containing dehydrogenase component
MAKYRIDVATERCCGCLRCALGCSDAHTQSFNPSAAMIQVVVTPSDCQICFAEDCLACGICADQCFYGALSKTKLEEKDQ